MLKMPTRIGEVFTRNVRERMRELGINQAELAKRIERGESFVSLMLSGYRQPGLKSLELFARALDVEPADLISEKKSGPR